MSRGTGRAPLGDRIAGAVLKLLAIAGGLLVLVLLFGGTMGLLRLQAGYHLVAGWFLLLAENLARFDLDPQVLIGGGIALILASVALHLVARRFRSGWSVRNSLASTGLLLVLFAASFLVPGVILVLRTPMEDGLTQRSDRRAHAFRSETHWISMHLLEYCFSDPPPGHLPDDFPAFLAANEKLDPRPWGWNAFLFPGAGLSTDADPDTAVIVTPRYRDHKDLVHTVITLGGEVRIIPATGLPTLLEKAAAEHRRTSTAP